MVSLSIWLRDSRDANGQIAGATRQPHLAQSGEGT
jgi:hypothetical protein